MTAGVYLIVRFGEVLHNRGVDTILLVVGRFTALMAGIGARVEYNFKKIIALSTLRQLGVMISAVGIGLYKLAYLHLLIHALFKALLFICAGRIIHSVKGAQDIREIRGILRGSPISSSLLGTARLALCGSPFLAGFYSKDLIIEILFSG